MKSLKIWFILLLPLLVLVYGQGSSDPNNEDSGIDSKEVLNLVTVHAEDAHCRRDAEALERDHLVSKLLVEVRRDVHDRQPSVLWQDHIPNLNLEMLVGFQDRREP